MKLMKFVLVVSVLQSLALPTFAQNREEVDTVFQEPLVVWGSQIFLGLAELATAIQVLPELEKENASLQKAQANLAAAREIPTSQKEKERAIAKITSNTDNYVKDFEFHRELARTHKDHILRIDSMPIHSPAAKMDAIRKAEAQLANAQETALKSAQKIGLVDKSLRILRRGTALLLVGDVVARAVVWDAASPKNTWSPMADYIQNQMK